MANISADRSKIAAITSAYSQANTTVASLHGDVSQRDAQVASLQGNVTVLQGDVDGLDAQISGLESTVSTLQSQVTALVSITSLGESSIVLSPQVVGAQPISSQVVVSFVANYSGYVTVSMSTISDIANLQVGILIFFGSSVNAGQYSSELVGPYSSMSVPDSLVFHATPGTISVYLADAADTAQKNATLTVTYHY